MLEYVMKFDEWLRFAGNTTFAARHPHVWLGVSVEDQNSGPKNSVAPANAGGRAWISAEPLLGKSNCDTLGV